MEPEEEPGVAAVREVCEEVGFPSLKHLLVLITVMIHVKSRRIGSRVALNDFKSRLYKIV